jgi:hypothetical protein
MIPEEDYIGVETLMAAVAASMKAIHVTIKDSKALNAIWPGDLKNYLTLHGWVQDETSGPYAYWWKSPAGLAIRVPSVKDIGDYIHRIADVLGDLEEVENRSQLEIFSEITGFPLGKWAE